MKVIKTLFFSQRVRNFMIFENKITNYKKEVVITLKYTYIRLDSANRLPEMPKKVVGNTSAGA
jgi:hypothetical protein